MKSNQLNSTSNEEALFELLTLTCKIDQNGAKRYYNKEGYLHRIHGPAIISFSGAEFWYKNGKRHREDGPASIWNIGPVEYWVNSIKYTKEEFIEWQKKNRK